MDPKLARDAAPPPVDPSTKMAYENLFLAQERTQMAWIQVSLAFISFGFTIAKFFEFLYESRGEQWTLLGPRTVGVLMIAIGLVFVASATVQDHRAIRTMRERRPALPVSQAEILAVLLVILGVIALSGAILRQ